MQPRTVSVIKNLDGLYLMNNPGFIDWTDDWANVALYNTPEQAKRDRDFLGYTLCEIITHDFIPPIPKPDPIRDHARELRKTKVYLVSERPEPGTKTIRCVKIGYSHDPMKRVKQLQTGHPHKIGLEGWFEFKNEKEARAFEKELHHTFKSKHMGGEWFAFDEEVMNFIINAHHNCANFSRVIT